MILSKKDYKYYRKKDRLAIGEEWSVLRYWLSDRWQFLRRMRRLEYVYNCHFPGLVVEFHRYRFLRISQKMGYSIPINTCGPGLSIAHRGTIAINGGAKLGENCRVHVCVNIGTEAGFNDVAPKIGSNCYIAPGAKLYGDIVLGDNTIVGANAVVNQSFPEGNCTIAGVPAKVVSNRSAREVLNING